MGNILPNFDSSSFTESEVITYAIFSYLLIGLYFALLVLDLVNIRMILIKQKEYKNLPILFFYLFTTIAICLRIPWLIGYWSTSRLIWNTEWIQQGAKLAVGVVQDWITLELAIRIKNTKRNAQLTKKLQKRLKTGQYIVFTLTGLCLVSLSTFVFFTANDENNNGYAFNTHKRRADVALGFCQLAQYVVMTSLTIYLMYETRRFH